MNRVSKAVAKFGNIKNCPSLSTSYGLGNVNSLIDVALSQEFKNYWGIHKDQINQCKDCQFRFICTDCRAFLEDKLDKPKKCNYDPYKNVWKN